MNFRAFTNSRPLRLLRETYTAWSEDNALRLSAALAYYSIFSIAPLLLIALSIVGLVLGDQAVQEQMAGGKLSEHLSTYLGPQAARAVEALARSTARPTGSVISAIVGFTTLLLGASGVFGQLKDALNTIWEVQTLSGRGVWGFVRDRLLGFGMVLVIGFLLLTSLLLSTALAALGAQIEQFIGIPGAVSTLLGSLVSFTVVTVLFALIFKVLPEARVLWRDVWIGAATTALLFEIGKIALGFYLGRASTTSSFGAAGSLVLLLLWVYYASCILLFGAEFTQVYACDVGHAIRSRAAVAEKRAAHSGERKPTPAPRPAPVPARREESEPSHALGALLTVTGLAFAAGFVARAFRPAGRK